MSNKQEALIAKEEEVVAVEPVVAAIPAINNDALLDMDEDEDWELEGCGQLKQRRACWSETQILRVARKVSHKKAKSSDVCC